MECLSYVVNVIQLERKEFWQVISEFIAFEVLFKHLKIHYGHKRLCVWLGLYCFTILFCIQDPFDLKLI